MWRTGAVMSGESGGIGERVGVCWPGKGRKPVREGLGRRVDVWCLELQRRAAVRVS